METEIGILLDYTLAAFTALTIYITIISGYLVVAYLVGDKLSRFELIIVSTLFVFFSVFISLGTNSFFIGAITYSQNSSLGYEYPDAARLVFWFQLIGIGASLWFMVNRRKDT